MKTCTNCQRQLDDATEICACGKWFRVASSNSQSVPAKKLKESPRWLIALTAIPILLLAKCVGLIVADTVHASRLKQDDSTALVKIADEINKNLPQTIDQYTRMDSVIPGPGNKLTYIYTLTQVSASAVDHSLLQSNSAAIAKSACNRASVHSLLAEGTTVVYAYKDRNGADITNIEVTPGSCAAP